ncbi:hypothetical protein N7493_007607 [Penicillium malachiteum]|uniref:Uncharacterized protein n=1 Tax=Penicillium malachiteum TaxID=1324776 RepID=A0AAD6HHY9_9EURO|nr:hypothetical protein N7493_007607 [Penicillium malachiteum]
MPGLILQSGPSWLPSPDQLGLVVARYNEPLDPWAEVASNTYLYAKSNITQDSDNVSHDSFRLYEQLPNEGREGQTYCHHIYNQYDSLEPIVIFSQANPFDMIGPETNTTQQMVQKALEPPEPEEDPVTIYNYDLLHDLAQWSKINWSSPDESYWITPSQLKTLTYAPYDMATFWKITFGVEHPAAVRVLHGAIFAVRREAILQHPKELYKNCLDQYADAGQGAVNPEMGFFMERIWLALWGSKFWLSDSSTAERVS